MASSATRPTHGPRDRRTLVAPVRRRETACATWIPRAEPASLSLRYSSRALAICLIASYNFRRSSSERSFSGRSVISASPKRTPTSEP